MSSAATASSEPDAAQAPRFLKMVPWAVAVSVLTLVALLVWYQARRDVDVLAALRDVDPRVLPLALGLHMTMHAVWALRIRILAGGLDVGIGYPRAWQLATAGQFGGAVTPGRFGAEALRLTLLVRGGARGTAASRLVLADRSTDMLFFATAGTVAAALLPTLFGEEAVALRVLSLVAVAGLLSMFFLLAWGLVRPSVVSRLVGAVAAGGLRLSRRPPRDLAPAVQAFLERVRDGLAQLLRERPWRLLAAACCTAVIWGTEFSILWVLLDAFGYKVPLLPVLAAGVLITMLAAVPLSPGGSGVAEVSALALLSGLAPGLTPAFVLVWRGLTYYYDLVVGGLVTAVALPNKAADGTIDG
ncbi:MAG: flippase-like domain-containing protein [Thermoplasmatota archaeon]